MEKIIATPSQTKYILEKYDLYAKKNFGQNFLVEPGIVDKIARNAITDAPVTIEIGPGIGALTQMLSKYAQKVYAFEIDDRLIPVLNDLFSEKDNVEIIHQDFLKTDLKARFGDQEIEVAANLPYYITTPLLFKLFESDANIKSVTVMMQKEVADRLSAKVNTKDYNALSVIVQYLCDVEVVAKVPRGVFNPKPKVDSTVLKFILKKEVLVNNEREFFDFVKACFKQRRKTIYNNLKGYINDADFTKLILEKAKIETSKRAESLDLTDFIKLYGEYQNEVKSLC